MVTTPTTVTAAATTSSPSTLQKIENWFKKTTLSLEGDLAKIVGPTLADDLETALDGLLKTAEGQIALTVVTEAADAVSGQVNVGQAVTAVITAIAKTGKTISQSAATALVAAAQQKVLSLAQPSS